MSKGSVFILHEFIILERVSERFHFAFNKFIVAGCWFAIRKRRRKNCWWEMCVKFGCCFSYVSQVKSRLLSGTPFILFNLWFCGWSCMFFEIYWVDWSTVFCFVSEEWNLLMFVDKSRSCHEWLRCVENLFSMIFSLSINNYVEIFHMLFRCDVIMILICFWLCYVLLKIKVKK